MATQAKELSSRMISTARPKVEAGDKNRIPEVVDRMRREIAAIVIAILGVVGGAAALDVITDGQLGEVPPAPTTESMPSSAMADLHLPAEPVPVAPGSN